MSLILFVVGTCLGLAVGAGAVTWARLADDHRWAEDMKARVTAEINEIQEQVRRIEKECIRWQMKNH